MLNPQPPKTKRLTAKDFYRKLKNEEVSWENVVDAWLNDVYKKFSNRIKTFKAPSEVDTDKDCELFISILGQRGFGANFHVRHLDDSNKTGVYMITLSIPPQGE